MLVVHKALALLACLTGIVAASIAPAGFWTGIAIGTILATSGWTVIKSMVRLPLADTKTSKQVAPVTSAPASPPVHTVALPPQETSSTPPSIFADKVTDKGAPQGATFMGEQIVEPQIWPLIADSLDRASHRPSQRMFSRFPIH